MYIIHSVVKQGGCVVWCTHVMHVCDAWMWCDVMFCGVMCCVVLCCVMLCRIVLWHDSVRCNRMEWDVLCICTCLYMGLFDQNVPQFDASSFSHWNCALCFPQFETDPQVILWIIYPTVSPMHSIKMQGISSLPIFYPYYCQVQVKHHGVLWWLTFLKDSS